MNKARFHIGGDGFTMDITRFPQGWNKIRQRGEGGGCKQVNGRNL
jgi:hypothetical protein